MANYDAFLPFKSKTNTPPGPCADGSGGDSCCTSSQQCGEGEGDCDTDVDCAGNLKCGQGNGFDDNCDTSLGFLWDDDCCYDPSNHGQ